MVKERIKSLRKLMQSENVKAYIIPSTDPHQSEYVPPVFQRRPWISGFDGSAGDVVITMDKGGLWTDSRYFAQAEIQLNDSGIDLMKIGHSTTPSITVYIKENCKPGDSVGIDPKTINHAQALKWEAELKQFGIQLKFIEGNLIDAIWEEQPVLPTSAIEIHPLKFSGESVDSKLDRIRHEMDKNQCDMHVLTMLDAIAWTFNLRGKDMDFNPVFISYAIITRSSALLFTKLEKITDEVSSHLGSSVEVYDYDDFKTYLLKLVNDNPNVWLDSHTTNHWIASMIAGKCRFYDAMSPVIRFKAVKNDSELAGYKACQVRDGVAMVNYLQWLENEVPKGTVTELSSAKKLEEFRSRQDMFVGPSFSTISSYKIHGGIIHYSVNEETDIPLQAQGIYLIDSGGQYLDGTTDITRTVALSAPTDEEKDRFTRVLMGHINLAITSFPKGTTGPALDTITRLALWEVGLNFGHGTGHGIGAYLGVHEGPQSINPTKAFDVPLEIGMICSNEPGYYKDKEYGMRVENLINVVRDDEKSSDEFEFYKFETTTLCPIDTRLVKKELMSEKQINWLNDYHKEVRAKLSPYVEGKVKKWLENVTREI